VAQLAEQADGAASLAEQAVIVCQRGAKIAATSPVDVYATANAVNADWENEKLSMISTFYRVEGKGFREKTAKFILRGIKTSAASDNGVALASGKLDLAQDVGADLVETRRQVALDLKSKIAGQHKARFGTLHLTVCCTWLKDARCVTLSSHISFLPCHVKRAARGAWDCNRRPVPRVGLRAPSSPLVGASGRHPVGI